MRVGMDISQIAHGGGVATYTRNLTEELSKFDDLEMVYFYSSFRRPYSGPLRNVKKFKLPPTLFEILFNKWRNIGIEHFIGPIDVYHSSDWTQPPTKAKKITTYHDVLPLKFPHWSNPKIVAVHKRRLKIVEEEIDCVIAVSQSTMRDLLEITRIPRQKIVVIYEGVNERFQVKSKSEIEKFKEKYGLPSNYVLAIGGVGERRNLKRVREACKGYHLIITGETLPWLDTFDMVLLYAGAQVLLYPSFYEGFGLPIIEAMSCGTPVITSDVSSMPEVAGEAALFVDPNSLDDIKDKLRLIVKDQQLRKQMIKRGFEQAKKFTWQKCARETAEVYRKVIGR